jgi:GTP cyclohydrolase I
MSNPEDLQAVRRLLSFIGEDPDREGLRETPARFLKAWTEYTRGYLEKPEDVLKVFEDGAQSVDEMVIVRDIPVYSLCEHHLAPFFGRAYVGYVPDQRILGLSKISRLVEVFSRRLQVQERLTNQIADALHTHLQPLGVAVVIECRHMCMESRGIRHTGTATVTSALRGSIKSNADTRREFLSLIGR